MHDESLYIDFKRNNKISLRNFSESSDHHDVIKLLLVRMLRRKYKKAPIYTEFNPARPQKDYPDIWIRVKKEVMIYEIQKEITTEWTKQIIEKHSDVDLIIVPTKKLSKDINKLKIELEEYIM